MNSSLHNSKGLLTVAIALTVAVGLPVAFVGCGGGFPDVIDSSDDFLNTGRTLSFFTAIQIDPRSEDSAGPAFVAQGDFNGDGLVDLVSAWNQTQPVQIHLQGRTSSGGMSFETVMLAGSIPTVSIAGLAVADFDQDGRLDIAVLAKETLLEAAACLDSEQPGTGLRGLIVLYLGPADTAQTNQALAWEEVPVEASFLQGLAESDTSSPESGGFTAMEIGDIDLDGDPDIVVAWNSVCGGGTRDVVIFTNKGPGEVRDGTWTGTIIPDSFPKGTSFIKGLALGDIDGDSDLDIVTTFPTAQTMNLRWYRNPAVDVPDDVHISDIGWQVGTVSQIASGADIVRLGDIDADGILDVVVRSTRGGLIQWLRGPAGPTTAPLRAIPWQVYTMAEFTGRTPEAMAIGDLNSDGHLDLIVSATGGLGWFDSQGAASVFDQWVESLIVDDRGPGQPEDNSVATDPNAEPAAGTGATVINSIIVVDLDGDGANDAVATFDRFGLSGLTNDALVWLRNTSGQ